MGWLYNGHYYNSAQELRAAWERPDFEKLPKNLDGDWTQIEDFEGTPERDDPPPIMIQPYSPRYKLDKEEKFVSWSMSQYHMHKKLLANSVTVGFEFYMAYSQIDGVTLYDIRYKGERIIYEVSAALSIPGAYTYHRVINSLDCKKQWHTTPVTILYKVVKCGLTRCSAWAA